MSFNPSGRFIATIAASDHKYAVPGTPTPAGFGVVIQHEPDGKLAEFLGLAVDHAQADENEALVLAVLTILQRCNEQSQIKLRSSSSYIVNAIKKDLKAWKTNGWLKSDKKPPKYKSTWIEIDRLLTERGMVIEAFYIKKADAMKDQAFICARKLAAGERDEQGWKVGAALSGFRPE